MKIADIQSKAKKMKLKVVGMNKVDLIRAIQIEEGNFPCFGSASEYCDRMNCCWRADCLPKSRR